MSGYEAKISHETTQLARRMVRAGLPQPFGDPLSGVVLVVEPPARAKGAEKTSAKMVDALRRSLAAVKLEEAYYVTWSSPDLLNELLEELLSLEPTVLVAVGPAAARAIDALKYPLAKKPFSETPEGSWFAWTKGTSGLKLPALAPAIDDAEAKRHFWQTFLALRSLAPEAGSGSHP